MSKGQRLFGVILCFTAATLCLSGLAQANQDKLTKPEGKVELKDGKSEVKGKLAAGDPKDAVRSGCYCKVYTIKLEAGAKYQIDLISTDVCWDNYLRLEDDKGKQLADDDDSGGGLNAQIVFECKTAGEYRIVATSYGPDTTGDFTLKVEKK